MKIGSVILGFAMICIGSTSVGIDDVLALPCWASTLPSGSY